MMEKRTHDGVALLDATCSQTEQEALSDVSEQNSHVVALLCSKDSSNGHRSREPAHWGGIVVPLRD